MSRHLIAAPLILLGLAAACSSEPGAEAAFSSEQALIDGTPRAVGLLGFLDDAATTLELLDVDVALHATAATNLVAHRDGPDGVFGTSDDDRFDDVAEVLAVKQIGPARLKQIADYAALHGWVPEGDDLLGVYDGVPFTVSEAEAVLSFVNAASFEELDVEVDLDKRAAESIVAAKPMRAVLALSELYYVGGSALAKLKIAAGPAAADEGADCAATADCATGLRCEGIPFDGAPEIGKCIDPNLDIPGYWDDCSAQEPCNAGLVCIGTIGHGGQGWCGYPWMTGDYASHGAPVAIPDDDPAGASLDVYVYGQASVPMDIVVTLDIDHPRPADLVVTLTSTNGSGGVLWNHEDSPEYQLTAAGIEGDNYINGTLTLHVVDTVSGVSGTLNGFELYVSSRYD